MTLLAGWWTAIWPNLVASLIWAPLAFGAHHVLVRRHITKRIEGVIDRVTDGERE